MKLPSLFVLSSYTRVQIFAPTRDCTRHLIHKHVELYLSIYISSTQDILQIVSIVRWVL